MISISGALIVTRASSDEKLGAEFARQLFGSHQPLLLASGVLVVLSAFPGLPTLPFLIMGSGLGVAGWTMHKKKGRRRTRRLLRQAGGEGRTWSRCCAWSRSPWRWASGW